MSSNGLRSTRRSAVGIGVATLALALTGLAGGQAFADSHAGLSATFEFPNDSGKCLEITNSSTANGARAQQWECKGQAGSKWQWQSAGDGFYNVVNVHSGKCLEIENSSTANGAAAQQWTCNGQNGAKWKLIQVRSGGGMNRYKLQNHSGKVLEITNSSTANGANAQQWEYKGQSGALWVY
ncbi:RICIN domain-containing protein [Kitasatospora sp. NPDC005856]|uniref:RICIN domain-containing protein n=1 Tax=Kitasatospora sp. NPDC005856 TaxID=3154566 RepID=UPI0033F5ACEB